MAGFTAALTSQEKKLSEDNWIQNFVTKQSEKTNISEELKDLSISKLKTLLSNLVAQENYEKAVRVRAY